MQLRAHHQHTEQWSSRHTIWFRPDMPADIRPHTRFRPYFKNLNPVHPYCL